MKCVTVFLRLGFGLSGRGLGVWLGGLGHCCLGGGFDFGGFGIGGLGAGSLGSAAWASVDSALSASASVSSAGLGLSAPCKWGVLAQWGLRFPLGVPAGAPVRPSAFMTHSL